MSYTLTTNIPVAAVKAALSAMVQGPYKTGAAAVAGAAGETVTLDTGETVWCCAAFGAQGPNSVPVWALAIQFVNGAFRAQPNGQPVACACCNGIPGASIAAYTSAVVFKAALMIVLGEAQPTVTQDGVTQPVFPGVPASAMSIRSQIAAADAIASPPTSVLE